MALSVANNAVSSIDFETQQLIKRYFLSRIYSVQDINDDPMFKSVLVLRSSAWQTPQKCGVDFFQCDKVPVSCITSHLDLSWSSNVSLLQDWCDIRHA